jgi:O-6-methylguanine DNA methyltransferase
MHLLLSTYNSPLAPLLLVADENNALRALDFADHESRMNRLLREHYGDYTLAKGAAPPDVIRALDHYFEGDLAALDNLRTATGGTPFQRAVWRALRSIKPGTTKSYGQIAARIGRPTASRAVGAANGANPIALVVPCHRVIGADGTLTGYGGGLARKQWLLDHERAYSDATLSRERPSRRPSPMRSRKAATVTAAYSK